ncbi:MAG: methionyl-tRNA formyltransferase [Clostridia bacterium]|nr:methionyl-tRNA formyltransferase [Clostridia bacterium]
MKIVFMGTPDFAVPCLDICYENHEVIGVFTQPDRPKGRGKKLAAPPVKEKALKYGLDIYQPEKLKTPEMVTLLKELAPDCIVVVAYGQLLSKEILDIPERGCVNVHASLLPKYRGASPINWCIVQGEKETGITTMYMDVGLDTGDMIHKDVVSIGDDMSFEELYMALLPMGAQVLAKTLDAIENGSAPRIAQNDEESSYAPLLNKQNTMIDWHKSAGQIHNHIRGLNPIPVALTTYEGDRIKIFVSELTDMKTEQTPGTIINVSKSGLDVATGDGVLRLKEVQFPNGKRLAVSQLILGHNIEIGIVLGQ